VPIDHYIELPKMRRQNSQDEYLPWQTKRSPSQSQMLNLLSQIYNNTTPRRTYRNNLRAHFRRKTP